MNETDEQTPDILVPKKTILHPDNIKKTGVWGAVITTIASMGYAVIQKEENATLLNTNTQLVQMVQDESKSCRDQLVRIYLGVNDEQ